MKFFSALLVGGGLAAAKVPLSSRMLEGIMSRRQGIISSGQSTSTLESGILAIAMEAAIAQYPDSKDTLVEYLALVIDTIAGGLLDPKKDAAQPLDRFSIATSIEDAAIAQLFPQSQKAETAYDSINQSLALQTRNPDGGLWYYVYPEWSYLDGVFSLLPFMASLPSPNYTDMALQISLLKEHCYHEESGLFVHGYDWSRKAVWADPQTGASPYVWGRSLAWFLVGLVQTWERLDCAAEQALAEKQLFCEEIQHITSDTSRKLTSFADQRTGAWWQLPTFPGREGNFLESSSTALFIFALLKGERIGMLQGSDCAFKETALRAYAYTKCKFVTDTGNGTIGYDKTVVVCSLNSTATYEYYTQRPVVPNGLLGEAAFVLASLEVERL